MALAAQQNDANVKVIDILSTVDVLFPDRESLVAATGWPREDIATIDVYRGSREVYGFPTLTHLRDLSSACSQVWARWRRALIRSPNVAPSSCRRTRVTALKEALTKLVEQLDASQWLSQAAIERHQGRSSCVWPRIVRRSRRILCADGARGSCAVILRHSVLCAACR